MPKGSMALKSFKSLPQGLGFCKSSKNAALGQIQKLRLVSQKNKHYYSSCYLLPDPFPKVSLYLCYQRSIWLYLFYHNYLVLGIFIIFHLYILLIIHLLFPCVSLAYQNLSTRRHLRKLYSPNSSILIYERIQLCTFFARAIKRGK